MIRAITLTALWLGGCVLITGGSDGYTELVDASAQAPTAAACPADASACVVVGCSSPADCLADDASAGGFCCLTPTTSPAGAALACQATACPLAQTTVCASSADCPVGLACETQQCSISGTSITFKTCGAVPCPG